MNATTTTIAVAQWKAWATSSWRDRDWSCISFLFMNSGHRNVVQI